MTDTNWVSIGFTPLDENNQPYRPTLGRRYWARKKPTTVYQSQQRAETYSPVNKAGQVFMRVNDKEAQ